jgi:hypothetical protein
MNPQAFTLTGDGLLSSIISPITTRQSFGLCQAFKLVCQEINVRALWDTGASGSSICKALAKHLDLKPIDMCTVRGVSGIAQSNVFLLDFLLPSNVSIRDVRVSEFIDNGIFDIIIGMDIITLGDFAISNKDRKTTVSFRIPPSDNPINFIEQIENERLNN